MNHWATIWSSDYHLGTRYCKASKLLEFLRSNSANQYYFVGDIIDTWNMGKNWYMDDDQREIIKIINNIWSVSHILSGNHDETNITVLSEYFPNNPILEAYTHYTLKDKKLLVVHGHQFDSSFIRASSDFHFSLAMVINRWYHSKNILKSAIGSAAIKMFGNPRMSKFYNSIHKILEPTDYDGVVVGHIHQPNIKKLGNRIVYYNCLMKGTRVITDIGNISIEKLVHDKIKCKVLSQNEITKQPEWQPIINWHHQKVRDQKWIQIELENYPKITRGLICTPDHEIITSQGRIKARKLDSSIHKIFINEYVISKDQLGFIAGTLLGDSSIAKKTLAYLDCTQINLDLIKYKANLLSNLGTTISLEKHKGGYRSSSKFYTLYINSSHQLLDLYNKVIIKKGYRSPHYLLEIINPIGLALWYMDDGCLNKQQEDLYKPLARLALQGFNIEDRKYIENWFNNYLELPNPIRLSNKRITRKLKYGVYLTKQGNLNFSREATDKFFNIIGKYIIPSMRYKLYANSESFKSIDYTKFYSNELYAVKIKSIKDFNKSYGYNPSYYNHRYCITVANSHNFMTTNGLVANCGDWVSNCTALVETIDGELKLV